MQCEERERLWLQYEAALDVFCELVDGLPGDPSPATSSRIMVTKAAKAACVYARTEWENHLREHACDEARKKYFTAGGSFPIE